MTATAQRANGHPVRATRPNVRQQGDNAQSQEWGNVYDAAAYEEEIARDAAAIWERVGDACLDRATYRLLYALLRRPIHAGHIIATSRAKGKPYESDGVRSAQVLIDRMNNVLGTEWWSIARQYEDGGKLCLVTVRVFDADGNVLATGESYGGMDRANTAGNLRKASFTNAAKLAFAAIGPGHEIYTQAIDYDPDLLPGALEDQNRAPAVRREAPAANPPAPAPEPEARESHEEIIARWLAVDDAHAVKRKQAHDGMLAVGAQPKQIARELAQAGTDSAALDALVVRIGNALDAAAES